MAAHGLKIPVGDDYVELTSRQPRQIGVAGLNGRPYPSLEKDREVCEAILALDPASNGELAFRAFEAEEAKTGLSLTDLAEGSRSTRINFSDIVAQPRRVLTTPTWCGIVNNGRAYSPFTLNVERLVPWRTLTGRQHFYLDHENYLDLGEHLPTYKPRPDHTMMSELERSKAEAQGMLLNYLTPHGKWHIHSTYRRTSRMMTLSRGGYPVWLNDKDAAELGITDNDWVEVFNDNGVFVQRCVISSRIPRGTVFVYHATERTVGIPNSPLRKRRAGMNNSLTRTRLKPVLMSGGYAQFTYDFNYWGPTGVNRDTFVFVRRVDKPELLKGGAHGRPSPDEHALPPRQVHRVSHLQRRLQEPVDRPQGRRVHVVEQRRDQARHRLSDRVGGSGPLPRRLGDGKGGESKLRLHGKPKALANIFYNPALPSSTTTTSRSPSRYEDLFNAPEGDDQPTAIPISRSPASRSTSKPGRTGTTTCPARPSTRPTIRTGRTCPTEIQAQLAEIERVVFFYLPRICNHCLNPSCVAACPSGALYKRGEDGDRAGQRGQVPGLAHVRVGLPLQEDVLQLVDRQVREVHPLLPAPGDRSGARPASTRASDASATWACCSTTPTRSSGARKVPEKELVDAQLDDPRPLRSRRDRRRPRRTASTTAGSTPPRTRRSTSSSRSGGIALPLHPEYRTMAMMFYVPPLSPVVSTIENGLVRLDLPPEQIDFEMFYNLDKARLPIKYLANLFSGGNEELIRKSSARCWRCGSSSGARASRERSTRRP